MPTLLTVQAFSVYGQGGGPRILRSLLETGPWSAISVVAGPADQAVRGVIPEYHVSTRPTFGRLESTRVRGSLQALELLYVRSLSARLDEIITSHSVAAVHSVPHGLDFVAAHRVAASRGLPLFVTIHDHPAYTLAGWPTRRLALRAFRAPWQEAAHRYVISQKLGDELVRQYGYRPYSIVTDGVSTVSELRPDFGRDRHLYFMGLFHFSYRPNLLALLKGLALYRERHSADVSIVLRGGVPVRERDAAGVPVTVLPWGSQADVDRDLAAANLLYLPLPFGSAHERFARFSLSTKLVTFLASGLPIFYHGPPESAAAELLSGADAGIGAYSLDPNAIADALEFAPGRAQQVSTGAIRLARAQFRLEDQRARFWRPLEVLADPGI